MANPTLLKARAIVAAHLVDAGRRSDADLVLHGGGDDFPETLVALCAVRDALATLSRFERTLATYADGDFWGEGDCHAALAFHDRGAFARATLAGDDPLAATTE